MACDNPITQAITVDDFKTQFYRDFTYADTWDVSTTYNVGDKVFYDVNNKFYQCLNNGVVGGLPTDVGDWVEISGAGLVSDLDITNAYAEACTAFNASLFGDEDGIKLGYLYLSAHYLVNDLNAGGLESASSNLVNSRSVGNVSESYSIPQWQLDDPVFAFYAKSSYGSKYLNMMLPRLRGNMAVVCGATGA